MNFLVESNNYIIDFSYFFLLFSCGFFLAIIPVSILWKKAMLSDEELSKIEHIPYEEKYSLENLKINNNESKLENIIEEESPDGIIIMRHNKEENGFEYWSDKNTVDFKILKAVCRKYCLTFNNKNLYIDSYKEYLKQKESWEKEVEEKKRKEEEEEEEFIEEEEDDCVFIKPKLILNEKTQKKEVKVEWKDNKFIRRGKINESPLYLKEEEPKIKLSFDDFKKLMKEKKN